MGAAAARRLAADGFAVAILSSSGKGEALGRELGGIGVTGSNQSGDDVKRLIDATMARFGRIDVLVNSAGHGPRAPLLDISDEAWHQGIDIYFLSAVRPIRLVTPILEAQGTGGSIINISTFATFEPDPAFPTSAVARAAYCCERIPNWSARDPNGIRARIPDGIARPCSTTLPLTESKAIASGLRPTPPGLRTRCWRRARSRIRSRTCTAASARR